MSARWPQVETNAFSIQIVTHVKRGSASAHGIDHHIAASGVTLQQLPNHPTGRCTFSTPCRPAHPVGRDIPAFRPSNAERDIPKRGGLNTLRRLAADGMECCRRSLLQHFSQLFDNRTERQRCTRFRKSSVDHNVVAHPTPHRSSTVCGAVGRRQKGMTLHPGKMFMVQYRCSYVFGSLQSGAVTITN